MTKIQVIIWQITCYTWVYGDFDNGSINFALVVHFDQKYSCNNEELEMVDFSGTQH